MIGVPCLSKCWAISLALEGISAPVDTVMTLQVTCATRHQRHR